MNSIPWLADIKDLSSWEIAFFIVIVIISSMATGFVIDAITQRLGFGTFFNGFIALVGACAGIYLRYRLFGSYGADDIILTVSVAIAAAFILLFALILAKGRIS